LVPWAWIGQTPGSYVEVPTLAAGSLTANRLQPNSEQPESRDLELLMLGALLVAALADLPPSASAADAVACWLPTLRGRLARPR
jgi:hypothetical protein